MFIVLSTGTLVKITFMSKEHKLLGIKNFFYNFNKRERVFYAKTC